MRPVKVPKSWGDGWYVRSMSSGERDAWEAENDALSLEADPSGRDVAASRRARFKNFRARYLVKCLCDEHGELMFGESDVEALAGKSAAALDAAFAAAVKLNAESPEEIAKLAGESVAAPSGG